MPFYNRTVERRVFSFMPVTEFHYHEPGGFPRGSSTWYIATDKNAKECSNYFTIVLISHTSKAMLNILLARL